MTVAVFALVGRKATILEANISQTIASASTALATGSIYTLPALFLWGIVPPYMQIVALCFSAACSGLAAMIPLRRLLIVQVVRRAPRIPRARLVPKEALSRHYERRFRCRLGLRRNGRLVAAVISDYRLFCFLVAE